MNIRNNEAFITVNDDWTQSGCEEREAHSYCVALYASEEGAANSGEPEDVETGTNLRRAYRGVLETAYVLGFRRAAVRNYIDDSEMHITLRGNTRRRQMEAQYQRRRHREQARERRYQRLADTLGTSPDPRSLQQFFRAWKRVTGYGRYGCRDKILRSLLAPAKIALVRHVVEHAKSEGWKMGISHDGEVFNGYDRIIYIDTRFGQVSFHVRSAEYGDLPEYQGQWSGDKGATQQILAHLYA